MSNEKPKTPTARGQGAANPAPKANPPASNPINPPPLFRKIDWLTFGVTTLLVMAGYWWTLAPNLTLEDSGELAVASMYAGIPHPPGYPVWTLYTWLWTVILPVGNIAWRVAFGVAVASAIGCGLLGLLVSRGSSMMMEGIADLKSIDRRWESAICVVSGFVAGMLLGFNGYMWSQSVIVEVYGFSVMSFIAVLLCLLRWIYAPHQRRYLYWGFFLFGICFTNHQTLIVAFMGIEIAIAAADYRMGRNFFLWNSIGFLAGLILKGQGVIFQNTNPMIFVIFNVVGVCSIAAYVWFVLLTQESGEELMRDGLLAVGVLLFAGGLFGLGKFVAVLGVAALGTFGWLAWQNRKAGSEWLVAVICGLVWVGGAAFYLYMALAGMTNPPMQWGYPRTVEGFIHAFTRGQYEKANPTDFFGDPLRFVTQLGMLFEGVVEEFNWVYTLIALVPFLFFLRMQKRERAWIIGITAIYLCLGVLLLILINPPPDRQARELIRVFFTASHVMIAMSVGYGLTLIAATMAVHYERFRTWFWVAGTAAAGLALYSLAAVTQSMFGEHTDLNSLQVFFRALGKSFEPDQYAMPVFAGIILLGMCVVYIASILLRRERAPMALALGIFALFPLHSIMSHWSDNEQRGHLFGYWFGHDMFTPPFTGPDGEFSYDAKLREEMMKDPEKAKFTYPEMSRDAILYGGTDPGRFCPTYMIFCESFIPPRCKKDTDPHFDRRDVYIITQNALADGTYLNYIRAHYNRSMQIDPPFFQELLRSSKERELNYTTNFLARAASTLLDKPLTRLGARIEARRRAEGVYPPKEIYIATPDDSQRCFHQYLQDAQRRLQLNQLRPGEDVRVVRDAQGVERVQVSGQVAVMSINGLLTKVMFDKNPTNEFYVEESFPLDWMYPHLTPSGVIMKINRETLPTLPEEVLERDHAFWRKYSERLIGDWITYDTSVKEIVEFVEKVYLRRDFSGFTGDRKFVRDDQAQKAFSKLRSSIGGVYAWRIGPQCPPEFRPKTPAEFERIRKEADFVFRQAFAYCPYSPEAVFRYVQLLTQFNRVADALLVAETCLKLDPYNGQVIDLVRRLRDAVKNSAEFEKMQQNLEQMEAEVRNNPTNFQAAFNLASFYIQAQQPGNAMVVLDGVVSNPQVNAEALLGVANIYIQMQSWAKVEAALERLVQVAPEAPEAWYDLANLRVSLGKHPESIQALTQALALSAKRLQTNPNARNLLLDARTNVFLNPLRPLPEFQSLVSPR